MRFWIFLPVLAGVATSVFPADLLLSSRPFHLRSGLKPEYDQFATAKPHGGRLEIQFFATNFPGPATLFIWQDDVKQDWRVELNGKRVGTLFAMEAPLVNPIALAPGVLKASNLLAIVPPRENDDIRLGEMRIADGSLGELTASNTLEIRVTESRTGEPLPCRLTIVDVKSSLVPIHFATNQSLAVRPGVVYAATGTAVVNLLPGQYTVYATRGPEYGLARAEVVIRPGKTRKLQLELTRELDTAGWVSCDTHIHTGTYARHGDATLDERLITLAGEGVELAVSTEHNQLVDFAPAAKRTGTDRFLTPVLGSEITTKAAHFNPFPIEPGAKLPDWQVTDFATLLGQMRGTPGVQVIVLNHPHNIHNQFQPFARTNFNPMTGENRQYLDYRFDALELLVSSAQQSDYMIVFRDWFALLNRGLRITAVGSSDCHDVSRYIVGQGRTYIRSADRDPGTIEVNAACANLLAGRALVSMGVLIDLEVAGQYGVGDLVGGLNGKVPVMLVAQAPSWAKIDRVQLFANGVQVFEQRIRPPSKHGPQKLRIPFDLPAPKHDVFLVAMATGPGVERPYWAIPRPFQPTSSTWQPRVIAATNPVWVDADQDGRFTPAREYGRQLADKHAGNAEGLVQALAAFDAPVAVHAVDHCRRAGWDLQGEAFRAALRQGNLTVRDAVERYMGF